MITTKEWTGNNTITHVIEQTFPGALANPVITGENPLTGTANFFVGSDLSKWYTNITTCGSIVYQNLYPGIDLRYNGTTGTLKREFVVAPGANPSVINLHYDGADRINLGDHGELIITSGNSTLAESPIVSYQMINNAKVPVQASYQLAGNNDASFNLGSYDPAYPLVIDPSLDFATYLAGSGDSTQGWGITADSSGSIYVTGYTASPNFPVTTGAFQTVNHGGEDVFVTKMNPDGSGILYSTYLGSDSGDDGDSIAVDNSGDAYVTGETHPLTTIKFPTTNGASVNGTDYNIFVTKLNPTGTGLVYSTILGETGDNPSRIVVDFSGDAYIAGTTVYGPPFFPNTTSAFQTNLNGTQDFFVTKLNPNGSMNWATFLGGAAGAASSGTDDFLSPGLALDSGDDIYITGYSGSTGYPTTAGSFQPALNGSHDMVVTKLHSDGKTLDYSTFIDGSSTSEGTGIAVNSSGYAFVTGWTDSGDYPTSLGAYQTSNAGATNGFSEPVVTVLNPAGSGLVWSTYLGGTTAQGETSGIVLDSLRDVTVLGFTRANDFPVTADAYQQALVGTNNNIILAQLYANGTTLKYSTYFGGSQGDTSRDLAGDPTGNLNNTYFTGYTQSPDFPVTAGAYQVQFINPAEDSAFIARFTNGACFTGRPVPNDNAPQTVTFTDTTANHPTSRVWNFGDGSSIVNTINGQSPPPHIYTSSGSFNVTLTTDNDLGITSLTRNNYVIIPNPVVSFTGVPRSGTAPLTVQFTDGSTESPTTWNWSFGDGIWSNGTTQNPSHMYTAIGSYTVGLMVNNTGGSGMVSVPSYITVLSPQVNHNGRPSYGQPNNNPDNGYTGPQPASQGGAPAKSAVVVQKAPPEATPVPVASITPLAPVQNPTILAMFILTLQEYQFWLILAVIIIILVAILRRWWIKRQNPLLFQK